MIPTFVSEKKLKEYYEKNKFKFAKPESRKVLIISVNIDPSAIANETIKVIATPGHTTSSVCYYLQPSETNDGGSVFTGDTLFTGGCGRIFECPAKTMWRSLTKLAALPDNTKVYCGHGPETTLGFEKSSNPFLT